MIETVLIGCLIYLVIGFFVYLAFLLQFGPPPHRSLRWQVPLFWPVAAAFVVYGKLREMFDA